MSGKLALRDALGDHTQRAIDRNLVIRRATVMALSPLTVEPLDPGESLTLDDDFELSQWMTLYQQYVGLRIGDVVVMHQGLHDRTLIDVVSDSPLPQKAGITPVADVDYTGKPSDGEIHYLALSRTRTVTLPTAGLREGQRLVVSDGTGVVDEFPVVLFGPINGGIVAALTEAWGRVELEFHEGQWMTSDWPSAPLPPPLQGAVYHVSPDGDDTHDGLSAGSAWKTVGQVNAVTFNPGDAVLFEGGATFADARLLMTESGSTAEPIVIGSYGEGMAMLPQGVTLRASWFTVDHLDLGAVGTAQSGLQCGSPGFGVRAQNIVVQRCHVHLDASNQAVGLYYLGDDLVVTGCYIHAIGNSAILLDRQITVHCHRANVSACVITDFGLYPLTYNSHGIYSNCEQMVVTESVFCGTDGPSVGSGLSPRCRSSSIARNHLAHCGIGVGHYPYDTGWGLSTWERNTVVGCDAAGLYVNPGEPVNVGDGESAQNNEAFVIRFNVLKRCPEAINGYGRTFGSYEEYGNTILDIPPGGGLFRPEIVGDQHRRVPQRGWVQAAGNYQLAPNESGAQAIAPGTITLPVGADITYRYGVKNLVPAAQNLWPNPSFETTPLNMTAQGATVAASTAQAYDGTKSLAITATGASRTQAFRGTAGDFFPFRDGPALPGVTYAASMYVRAATVVRPWSVVIGFWDSSDGFLKQVEGALVTDSTTGWKRVFAIGLAPPTTAFFSVAVKCDTVTIPSGEVHYTDGWMMSPGPSLRAYGDGNRLGWKWQGLVGASASIGPPAQNLCPNPNFERDTVGVNAAGWAATGFGGLLTGSSWRASTDTAQAGVQSMRVVAFPLNSGACCPAVGAVFGAGVTYCASVWMFGNSGGEHVRVVLGGDDDSAFVDVVLTAGWQQFMVDWTPTADRSGANHGIALRGTLATQIFYVDLVCVMVGSGLTVYADGDSLNWAWLGASGNSVSQGTGPVQVKAPGSAIDLGGPVSASTTMLMIQGQAEDFEQAPDGINWLIVDDALAGGAAPVAAPAAAYIDGGYPDSAPGAGVDGGYPDAIQHVPIDGGGI